MLENMKPEIKKKQINICDLRKTVWCSLPWLHIFINPEGKVKPCCRFRIDNVGEIKIDSGIKNLSKIFLGPSMKEIREKMLQNKKIEGCLRCYQEEDSGKKSLRERCNRSKDLPPDKLIVDLNKPKITWIELALSNDCNLACRMCDSRYSTKWFNDEKEFYKKTFSKTKKTKCNINAITPFLKDLLHIKFTGGEPLMTPDHFTLIDKLLELKNTDNISLNYSTNLTIKPSESLVEKWKKFKYVEIYCSFDGVGETWEFVRYPSRWKKAEKVLRYLFGLTNMFDCRLGFRSTISVNNILGMVDSFKWWIKNWDQYASKTANRQYINPTHLTLPRFLSSTVLPKKYKDIVAEKLTREAKPFSELIKASIESQINYMFNEDNSQYLKELKDYTLHFDRKREQDFFKVNPEFKGLFSQS